MNLNKISSKNIIKFIVLWIILSGVYVVALSAAAQALPKGIEWMSELVFPLSLLFALIVSFVAISRGRENQTIDQAFKNSAIIGAYGAGVLVVIYMFTVFLIPADAVTSSQLERALSGAGLTDAQRQEVLELLEQQDYVTTEELQQVGLTETQIEQIIEIVRRETADVRPATQPDTDSLCYIGPKAQYASVTIRREPYTNYENAVGYLARGEQVKVIGYTFVDNSLWWKVEINHGIGTVQGWVIHWPVEVSSQTVCDNLPRVTTP